MRIQIDKKTSFPLKSQTTKTLKRDNTCNSQTQTMIRTNDKATNSDSFIIEMDQLIKQQTELFETKCIEKANRFSSKRVISAFAIFGALFIAISAIPVTSGDSSIIDR